VQLPQRILAIVPLDLAAASRLRAAGRKTTVMVAGSGPLEGELRGRAAPLGVKLILLGFQNQTEMPTCYAAAEHVLPSGARETWGLVVNEALACGRPVVVSDAVGCAPDLAADGSVGRSFPIGDIRCLAEAIAALHDRPPSRAAIRVRIDEYSVDAACEGIEAALAFISARRRRSKHGFEPSGPDGP
jgi:glycosyltransferase involved in cell wall biosynthesis